MAEHHRVLVDTDCGVDDAVALRIIAAAGCLTAITSTWGNVSAAVAARNAVVACPGQPVWVGDQRPPRGWRPAPEHGPDGLGGAVRPQDRGRRFDELIRRSPTAAERISEFIGETAAGTILCIGPLVNIACALRAGERVSPELRIVVMAGTGVDQTPAVARMRDTNTQLAPWASAVVAARVDARIDWVGLDITRRVRLDYEHLQPDSIPLGWMSMRHYGIQRPSPGTRWSVPCHDGVAAVAALRPDLFEWSTGAARVLVTGGARIVGSAGTGLHRFATDIDVPGVAEAMRAGVVTDGQRHPSRA